MFPDEFLSREQFDALPERERAVYLVRFMAAMAPIQAGTADIDAAARLAYLLHFFEVAKWVMSPEEYERIVRSAMWDAAMENAEEIRASLSKAAASDKLSDEERAKAEAQLRAVQAMVEHKRDLSDLPEADL